MKNLIKSLIAIAMLYFCLLPNSYASNPPPFLMTKAKQKKITPVQALDKLKQGNLRFVKGDMRNYDLVAISKYSADGQYPFAIVLNCVDSRSAPDYTFDQGLGNIFISRIAANVVDKNVLGGMEFATKFAGAKLIVVMGHTYCGAVVGACNNIKTGNLRHLLGEIRPAVKTIKAQLGKKFSCDDDQVIDMIAKQNVLNQMRLILSQSKIIKNLVKKRKIMLVGAMHNLVTRKVAFFDINGKPM